MLFLLGVYLKEKAFPCVKKKFYDGPEGLLRCSCIILYTSSV